MATETTFRRGKLQLSLTGIRSIDKRLKQLEEKVAKRIVRNALRAGARVGARRLKAAAPVGETKNLKRSIGSSFKNDRKAGYPVAKFGANVGKKRKDQARHGAAVLKGTKARRQKTTGRRTGRIEARPIVRKTWQSSRGEILRVIRRIAEKGLRQAARGDAITSDSAIEREERQKVDKRAKDQRARSKRLERARKARTRKLNRLKKQATRKVVRISKKVKRQAKRLSKKAQRTTKKLSRKVSKAIKSTKKKLLGTKKKRRKR